LQILKSWATGSLSENYMGLVEGKATPSYSPVVGLVDNVKQTKHGGEEEAGSQSL
jgi:hypothetical protein